MTVVGIAIVAGLGLGAMYSLIAMGYALVLSASGIFNFAQGSVVMGGALVLFWLGEGYHIAVLAVLGIVLAGGMLLGIGTYAVAVLPLVHRTKIKDITEATLVTTLGLGLGLNGIVALTFGPDTFPVQTYVTDNPIHIDGIPVRPTYIVMLGATVIIAIVLALILQHSKVGLRLRATFQDPEGAELLGISNARVVACAFAVSGLLAAAAGFLIAPIVFASASIAGNIALYGFGAMAIGGFGSFLGALLGGMIVGLVSQVLPVWVSPDVTNVCIYALILGILLIRPRGLLGPPGAFGAEKLRRV